MMEFARGWVTDFWGATVSAAVTAFVFTGLPALNFVNPPALPLTEAVFEVERPVFVDMEALLALQPEDAPDPSDAIAEPQPADTDSDTDAERGDAAEAAPEEQLAAVDGADVGDRVDAVQDAPGEAPGSDASTAGAGEAGASEGGPYTVQMAKVVAGPRVRFTLNEKPQGASGEQVGEFMAAMRAGTGIRPRSKGKRGRCRKSNPDIHPQADGSYEVNRSLVEHYTSSLKNFNSLGWSGPYNENGERGWKIGGFGCNSPLHFAGLRRGDIVKSVNGKKTNTWLQVFGAYRKLKHKDDFVIALVRRGETIELRYRLI